MMKKILSIFAFMAIFSYSQTFTSGLVELGNGSSNMFSTLSIGADGKFYCFFNDGDFVSPTNNVNPVYRLVRWEPSSSSWASVYNFDASLIPGSIITSSYTMFNNGIGFEVDTAGGYHILINVYTANGLEIKYAYSSNGSTWTYTNIDNTANQTNYSYSNLQLKLDSSNRPHIYYLIRNVASNIFSGKIYTLIHKFFNGSSWVTETPYSQNGGNGTGVNDVIMTSASIDGNNKSHIAFIAETNGSGTDGSLLYINNTSGSWSTPVFLATGATSSPAADRVAILSDSNNKQHIVYRENLTSYKLKYLTNKSGTWSGGQINGSLISGIVSQVDFYNAFTRNANNDLLLIYNNSSNTNNTGSVNYASLFNGAANWQIGSVFTGNSKTGQYMAARWGASNKVMVTFDHFTDPAATGGSPSYSPQNPRQVQYATAVVNNLSLSASEISKSDFKIFPNPAKSVVNINLKNHTNATVQIIDFNGNTISSKVVGASDKIDVASLSPGIYLLKVTTQSGTQTSKFIKE